MKENHPKVNYGKTGVLLINLGTPDSTGWWDIRKYLKEFLSAAKITMEEFHKICDKFTNKELFQTDQNGNLVKDKDGNLTLKNEIT